MSLRVGYTLKGKNTFDKGAAQFNVNIRKFKADNAPFSAIEFKNYVANKGQEITFSGVYAHHPIGIAQREINAITSWSRMMMLHTILHWLEQTTLYLWSFSMDHTVYCWNHLPNKAHRIAPLEAFTGV
jgi:hypothetical protein